MTPSHIIPAVNRPRYVLTGRPALIRFIAGCLILTWCVAAVHAADHFLTIGGGSSASNNQVSLEKNVLYLQRFLADAGLGGMPHEILFSDGAGGARDLQFVDPKRQSPRVNELLAEIFHQERGLDTQYRQHAIPHLWGPSGRQSITRWFDSIGSKLRDDDRLFIYYTGHGGRVSVVMVMVQCFGGGFADAIFEDADVARGLSPRNRCGFFATTPDRVAAGCTADVDEENYREYSTYFWAALYGRQRTGQLVPAPDYDGDGRVSFAEAHAYSLVNSDTVDLSMKTSDVFLRQFSKMKSAVSKGDLIDADSGYETLIERAAAPERVVLEGLSERLKLDGFNRTQAARTIAQGIQQRRKALEDEQRRLKESRRRTCNALQSLVKVRWPELTNFLNPGVTDLLSNEGEQIVRAIESAPQYAELHKQDDRLEAIDDELTDIERKSVKCQRFIRIAENVALAANLPLVASPQLQARFKSLLAAEGGTLGLRGK